MASRDDVVGRLAALIDQHSPQRLLIVVRNAVTARWLASLLAQRGVVLGARILDLEALLASAATELAGEPLGPLRTLEAVRAALLDDPQERYAAIADQPSYQRAVLRSFIELERAIEGDAALLSSLLASCEAGSRDWAMLEVFARFRESLAAGPWWRGRSLALVLAGHRRVSFLRRRAAAVALGFFEPTLARWEARLLEALAVERWDWRPFQSKGTDATTTEEPAAHELRLSSTTGDVRAPLDLRLSCAGPEAEIAAVARLLRADPDLPTVVLAPAEALPRWAARLEHRDVPVRAWVDRRAGDTSPARTVRALLRMLVDPEAVRRADLEAALFGPALRAWSRGRRSWATPDPNNPLEPEDPGHPRPGDLRAAWEDQRASSFSLSTLGARIRKAAARNVDAIAERAARFGWAAELLAERVARVEGAHAQLAATVDQLAGLAREWSPASLRTLLDDWDLLGRAAVHGVASAPMSAARMIVDLLARARPELTPAELAADLDHALAIAAVGTWTQSRSIAGGPPVWLLPYASASELGALPARVILTGLDRHPSPPAHHGPVSESLRASVGLVPDAQRFTFELRELDAIVARASPRRPVVGSWRHRDGAGNRRPPGPWIAGRQDEGRERWIGVDAIALPLPDLEVSPTPRPTSPLEHALIHWADEPRLRRRVEAIRSHDAAQVGPHTGELGVAVVTHKPYSASALQRYAALPYAYFVERVIGLREREDRTDSASALLATEQGVVVHRALEAALAARLARCEGPLELATIVEPLLAEVLEALAAGYRQRAEHGQAEAIWASERDRWITELSAWWQHWQARLLAAWGPNPSRRKPEAETLIPSPFLLAAEWSPAVEGETFELELGERKIPFVAAIDRVEIDPLRQRLNVCDYKTGRPRWPAAIAAELRAGVHLQLPLYALAVAQAVARAPERLRLSGFVPVGALRLEYLQRPLPSAPGRPVVPQSRAFSPDAPLGVDEGGVVWTINQAAISFALAFVTAIEAGRFPVVARTPTQRRPGRGDRLHELVRVVPSAEQRSSGLPPALRPLADQRAREVVQ